MKLTIKKILNNYGQVLILIALIILATILTKGVFLKTRNLLNILRQVSMMGLISLGVTLVIITKGIDLSSGAILALVTVVVASLTQQAFNRSIMRSYKRSFYSLCRNSSIYCDTWYANRNKRISFRI